MKKIYKEGGQGRSRVFKGGVKGGQGRSSISYIPYFSIIFFKMAEFVLYQVVLFSVNISVRQNLTRILPVIDPHVMRKLVKKINKALCMYLLLNIAFNSYFQSGILLGKKTYLSTLLTQDKQTKTLF